MHGTTYEDIKKFFFMELYIFFNALIDLDIL